MRLLGGDDHIAEALRKGELGSPRATAVLEPSVGSLKPVPV